MQGNYYEAKSLAVSLGVSVITYSSLFSFFLIIAFLDILFVHSLYNTAIVFKVRVMGTKVMYWQVW